MSNEFRIQWHDSNDDKDGSFKGRNARHTDWKDLDGFTLSKSSTYDFYLSQYKGLSYDAFITISTTDGTASVGAMIPKNYQDDDDNEAVEISGVEVGTNDVKVTASYLVSGDPKVQVTWGKTSNATATVKLVWNGHDGWTYYGPDGTEQWPTDCTLSVRDVSSVLIVIQDASTNKSIAAVYEVGAGNTGVIDGVQDLGACTDNTYTFTYDEPTSSDSTTYTVNLFNKMKDGGTLTVG